MIDAAVAQRCRLHDQRRVGAPSTGLARERDTELPVAPVAGLAAIDVRRVEHPIRIGDASEAEQQVCQCGGIDMSEPRSVGARIAERPASTVIRVLVVDEHRNPGHGEPSPGASRWPGRQSPKQYTRQPPGLNPGAAGQNTRSIAGLADDRQPESYNNQTSSELAIEQAPGCNRLILSA